MKTATLYLLWLKSYGVIKTWWKIGHKDWVEISLPRWFGGETRTLLLKIRKLKYDASMHLITDNPNMKTAPLYLLWFKSYGGINKWWKIRHKDWVETMTPPRPHC